MVEVPAGSGGEEDGGELVLEREEDVAPVYVLVWSVLVKGLRGGVLGADLPHFLGYQGYFGRVGEIVRKGFHAP